MMKFDPTSLSINYGI
uniref:Uncharacterized protein n=1 Tax=Anguilla anguilla TaxID=7936 RepID=A0A0E9QXC9_ANGAN